MAIAGAFCPKRFESTNDTRFERLAATNAGGTIAVRAGSNSAAMALAWAPACAAWPAAVASHPAYGAAAPGIASDAAPLSLVTFLLVARSAIPRTPVHMTTPSTPTAAEQPGSSGLTAPSSTRWLRVLRSELSVVGGGVTAGGGPPQAPSITAITRSGAHLLRHPRRCVEETGFHRTKPTWSGADDAWASASSRAITVVESPSPHKDSHTPACCP